MTEKRKNLTRRSFFAASAFSAATLTLIGSTFGNAAADLKRYEPNLRDRLWMWGHGPGTTDNLYNIPKGKKIDMADAIDYMGIPNVYVIRWEGKPEPPFDEYIKQFRKTKRVGWSIIDGAKQSYEQKKQWAFELFDKMPNLIDLNLDDFFHGLGPKEGETVFPAGLTLKQLEELKKEMNAVERKPNLSVVLYTGGKHGQLHPSIKKHLDYCDVVLFWTWHATDLVGLEDNFKKYREIMPDKQTLLGLYMWDFGNAKPITMELMKHQLTFALEKFKQGQIDGMIFHCTPLVDTGLEAVEYSKKWIAEYGDITR
ncbi:MAG: hypothetical protein FWE67_04485 [Planctomycetaceae bacterium]|nr:hypothetical protein [Planctomycetaceae bacterium]